MAGIRKPEDCPRPTSATAKGVLAIPHPLSRIAAASRGAREATRRKGLPLPLPSRADRHQAVAGVAQHVTPRQSAGTQSRALTRGTLSLRDAERHTKENAHLRSLSVTEAENAPKSGNSKFRGWTLQWFRRCVAMVNDNGCDHLSRKPSKSGLRAERPPRLSR